jgi:hypothetical protein
MKEPANIAVESSDGIPKMRREVAEKRESFEVAVLISGGFGAGWSTWSPEYSSVLLFHKDIVKFILENPAETCVDAEVWDHELSILVEHLVDDDSVYMGGAEQLEVVWLPEGTPFIVTEYDGAEGLRTLANYKWNKA